MGLSSTTHTYTREEDPAKNAESVAHLGALILDFEVGTTEESRLPLLKLFNMRGGNDVDEVRLKYSTFAHCRLILAH